MPGLRSLVARRRSSLTSSPYGVQRNTPSPSLSDTSENAVTPHNSEGCESPMTERGGGVGEVQETQGQDVSDMHGTVGSKGQSNQFINGEDTEEGDGCSSVSVGNSEQEKSLIDTNRVEDPGGELHKSHTSGIQDSEENETLSSSNVGIICPSSSVNEESEFRYGEASVCGDTGQTTQHIATPVRANDEQSFTHTNLYPSEGDTASHEAKSFVSEETNEYKKEEHIEMSVGKESDSDHEGRLHGEEETQGSVKESFNVDLNKESEINISESDIQEETCELESFDTSVELSDGRGREERTTDVCIPRVEGESHQTDESLQNVYLSSDPTGIPEGKEDPRVVEEGANEETKRIHTDEESDHRVTEFISEYDKGLTETIEKYMDLDKETCVPETSQPPEPESVVEEPENYEDPLNSNIKETPCIAGEDDDAQKEAEPGENISSCGVGNGGRDNLENPIDSFPTSIARDEEGEVNNGSGSEMFEMNVEGNTNIKELDTTKYGCGEEGSNYSESVNVDTGKETRNLNEKEIGSDSCGEHKQVADGAGVISKDESPSLNKKDGDSEPPPGGLDNKNVCKSNQKNAKGGKKCSDLSAMEIESTLASRGVTIVRRVVDNKESASRASELSNTIKKESVTSIKPVNKGVFGGTTACGSGISVSLQPSLGGQANSPSPKDLYKSINARGTHIQSSSKINPALLNRKGSFQLTRGVSIHYNPKSTATNMNVKGNTVYPNPRGITGVGSRGPRMYTNPRVPGPQTLRGYTPNTRPRGPTPQIRRGIPQTNLRGPVTPVNSRGMPRPQRYTGPRGAMPRGTVPQPRAAAVTPSGMRGVAPQRFRGGMSQQQQQPRLPGIPSQVRPNEGILTSTAGETLQSRSTTAPPQAKYLKTSPDSRPGDMPLQSKGAGISQAMPPDTVHSPQPGSAVVSSQSLLSGIQPQSEYGGPSTQVRSPQTVLAMSSASATPQTGPVNFTSQSVPSNHPTLPSSSLHLPQMNMMDHSPQTNTMGLSPHSVASRLPPHSSGGFLAHTTSLGSSSQVMSSHMGSADRFSTGISSGGFSNMSNSEYLGRPGSEMFSSYSNTGQYTPHSTASGFPHMNSGNFGLQSTSGGFHTQTNLVGFPAQNDPCGYSQHPTSNEFPHNSGGVVRQSGPDAFVSHPNSSNFPVPGNPGTYPPIPCSEPYNTPTNPGTFRESADMYNYPGQRDFMMHTSAHYNTSNQMTDHIQPLPATGHRDLPMSQSPRDLPIQNCNQGVSIPSSGVNSPMNNIIGDQYTNFGEPLNHPTYQEIPVNTRTNANTVPLAPNFRETDVRQNFRDSATPHYSSYREPNTQDNLRTSQMHSGYRDLPLDPNVDLQTQSAQSDFKNQQSARYQEDGMISRYLEQSVLNYPETGNLNACRDQPVPNFGSPASHTSPNEQVLSSCRDNMNQINFPDTINDASSRQQLMPGLGEPMNYGGYRGPHEYNTACEQPNPNLNYVPGCRDASNVNPVAKSVAGGMYQDHIPVSSYNVTSHHLSVEGVQGDMKFKEKDNMNYSDASILPSFTESFDHSGEMSGKKAESSNLPHFRGSSNVSYQRNLPEYTNPTIPFDNHGGETSTATKDGSYSCISDSKNSEARESPAYPGQRGYGTPCDSYSPAHSSSPDQQYIRGSGNNFQTKSDFHIPGDSLVPPDKGILEYPISQGSSFTTSTNNTQSGPCGKSVPESFVTNPETDLSSSKVTSVNHGEKSQPNFSVLKSHKDAKESEMSNFLGCGKSRDPTRSPSSDGHTKSPGSNSFGSLGKYSHGMSPNKSSDSGSPSTQDRIVIKMKLLHSGSSPEEDLHNGANANITSVGMSDKSSMKYNLSKYTCWTIDSIINGREDLGNEKMLDKVNDCEIEESERGEKTQPLTDNSQKIYKKINSEICEDSRDMNLDTNKNFMKKSLKITITNPLRTKMSPKDDDRKVESKHEDVVMETERIYENGERVQSLGNETQEKVIPEQEQENQLHYLYKKEKIGSGKFPSPNSRCGVQSKSDSLKCSKNNDISGGGGKCGAGNDHLVTSDVKKCSIVIKRIYKNDNYSCYSSSLCDKKTVLNMDDGIQRRSKRRAALEANERCLKTLRSLETGDVKSGKVSLTGVLKKHKDILSVNLTTNKTIINQIPQCSVILYDVFMNHRINQMVCPGCSRHYDSSDSVQVNMNKATISLLCSSCQWLVVRDVHPQEVDSMVPS